MTTFHKILGQGVAVALLLLSGAIVAQESGERNARACDLHPMVFAIAAPSSEGLRGLSQHLCRRLQQTGGGERFREERDPKGFRGLLQCLIRKGRDQNDFGPRLLFLQTLREVRP